jgi:predicted transcriptional regulator
MSKEVYSVDKKDSILEVLDLFLKNYISVVLVKDGNQLLGVIDKKDIIAKLEENGVGSLESMPSSAVMSRSFVSCEAGAQLSEVFSMLMAGDKKTEAVVVKKDGKPVGVIDYFDFIKVFAMRADIIDNPPIIAEAMGIKINTIDFNAKISQLVELFNSRGAGYAIVIKKEKPVGIVTGKDVISALTRNMDISKTPVGSIMSNRLVTRTPGDKITDIFSLLLDRRFNQIPLVAEGKIAGVADINDIVKTYYRASDFAVVNEER